MRIKIFSVVLLLGFMVFFSGCSKDSKDKECQNVVAQIVLTDEEKKDMDIAAEKLEEKQIDVEVVFPAEFKAKDGFLYKIYSPVDGKITNLFVNNEDFIKNDRPLVEIKSDEIYEIQTDMLEKIAMVDSEIKEVKSQYKISLENYEKDEALFLSKMLSKNKYAQTKTIMEKDSANLASLQLQKSTMMKMYQRRLEAYGVTPAVINTVLNTKKVLPYITINSDKNGILQAKKISQGEYVRKNQEMFEIVDTSTIWLVGYVDKKNISSLKTGQEIIGIIEEESNYKSRGILSYIPSALDKNTKTFEIRADVYNPHFKIEPGMKAEMIIKTGTITALAIPQSAIEHCGNEKYVYIKVGSNVYEKRKIELGRQNSEYVEVKSGVKEGEKVVLKPLSSLKSSPEDEQVNN